VVSFTSLPIIWLFYDYVSTEVIIYCGLEGLLKFCLQTPFQSLSLGLYTSCIVNYVVKFSWNEAAVVRFNLKYQNLHGGTDTYGEIFRYYYYYYHHHHHYWGTRCRSWLRYKLGGRGFDSQWCHWNFSVTYSFRPHYGPEVDSASNRNEYQEYFLEGKGSRCVGLQTYHLYVAWEPQPPVNLRVCPGL